MTEEDEIDVLGEFNLDTYLEKTDSHLYGSASLVSENTELLNCDYTIHPQWLLDKPSTNPDNWYNTNSSTSSLDKVSGASDTLGYLSTENSISDESGWTEKEKKLLETGIGIFGKSNIRLSQIIGSKTPSEVKYYLKNFYLESHSAFKNNSNIVNQELNEKNLVSDVLNDTQIPASIEEVIEVVSTAETTVQGHKRGRKKKCSNINSYEMNSKNYNIYQPLMKSGYKKNHHLINASKTQPVELKLKTKKILSKESKSVGHQKMRDFQTTKLELKNAEITTGEGLAVPICKGEEIIKIKKIDDESELDVEVDIEDSDEDINIKKSDAPKSNISITDTKDDRQDGGSDKITFGINSLIDLSTISESTMKELKSLEEPTSEVILDKNHVTDLEKIIHYEFFEGRPAKTPSRYMKIRNHIINVWLSQKPNYVTKTSIRQGLKNCGDVNCIGRIHYFLEQIGAINFGCVQMNYVRPLYDMIQPFPIVKDKPTKDVSLQPSVIGSRPRYKRKFNNDGEGGCTLTHDEEGHVINTTVVNEEPKQRTYVKKSTVQLVYCRSFTDDNPQPYSIRIDLSTLLKMDFHAHTSLTEVMGLIGGYWSSNENILIINHYEPCLNIASSATHCDMCPISQAKASEIIHNKDLNVLGWFHSHPTFAPEPSHQDIETQLILQRWIGHDKPCVGVILNPFHLSGALIASSFRCMMVDKKVNFEDQMVPYKFNVDVDSGNFIAKEFLEDIRDMFEKECRTVKESKVKLNKPYFQNPNISYLDKYLSSVRMHLAKCVELPKMICDNVLQGILNICGIKED